jgi:hypothetical protein
MKLAVLSESGADEAAVRILVEAIVQETTEPVSASRLATRGWPSVVQVLPAVLRYLHYRTDTEAFVVVADSNHSPLHEPAHESEAASHMDCRLCRLHSVVNRVLGELQGQGNRPVLKVGVGLAAPTIEAWYLCGRNPRVTEAAWVNGQRERRDPYTKNQLKTEAYGTDRPSLALETARATEAVRRLAGNLTLLENLFPIGFGALARDVRAW